MTELIIFDKAYQALIEAKTVDEVKEIRDKAEALRLYARQQGEGLEMQNMCAEIKIRAERRAGELLAEMPKATGGQPYQNGLSTGCTVQPVESEPPTLADLGIEKTQSHRWQTIAALPEETFEQEIAEAKAKKQELTSAKILKVAKREKVKQKLTESNGLNGIYKTAQIDNCKVVFGDAQKLDLSQFEKYGAIIADPPWPYRVTIKQGTTEGQYETMTDEDLQKIPVAELAMPDCVLFLWGTWPKLPEAIKLIEAWGFNYVTGFPWVKETTNGNLDYGVGYWIRGVSEYVLIAKRGKVSVEPLRLAGFLGLMGPNIEHSRKPDSVHQLAEKLKGPYLELFARRPRHGWTVFGNDENLFQKTFA